MIRPLCSLRRLARSSRFPLELVDLRRQWTTDRPTGDIRRTLIALQEEYRKKNEERREKHFVDLYPFEGENSFSMDFDQEHGEVELRYPRQSNDFYATFPSANTSLLKERPYETGEHSNEGHRSTREREKIFIVLALDSSPKRTLIVRQNLIKNKSPVDSLVLVIPLLDRCSLFRTRRKAFVLVLRLFHSLIVRKSFAKGRVTSVLLLLLLLQLRMESIFA